MKLSKAEKYWIDNNMCKRHTKYASMRQMKKHIIISILIFFGAISAFSQKVEFTANSKKVVSTGERFRVTYSVNETGDNFKAPAFDNFSVLSGPSRSVSTSIQSVNGSFSKTTTVSYSYILSANKEGTFSIPGAKITIEGKQYTSNSLSIEVVKGGNSNATASSGNSNSQQSQSSKQSATAKISGDDLFVRVHMSKRKAYVGEPIVATVKVYTKKELKDFSKIELPKFPGFYSQSIEEPQRISLQRENVGGKVYETAMLQKMLLFPQKIGKVKTDQAEIECVYYYRVQRQSWFDNGYREATKVIKSNVNTIEVLPLPKGKPASFSGAVGSFTLSAQTDKEKAITNDPVNLKITLSGTGNIKLAELPAFDFPPDFEIYDPQIKNSIKNTTAGSKGAKTWEYLIVPRHAGTFTIPAIEFDYFDLATKTYKKTSTKPITIEVEKGEGGSSGPMVQSYTKEDVQVLGTDIKFIKTGEIELKDKPSYIFGTFAYWLLHVIPALLLTAFILFRIKQIRENSNVAKMKNRKAGKVSKKHLKVAQKYLSENKESEFYESVLKALWGYLSDKLNIPVAELNKDTIKGKLLQTSVKQDEVERFLELVNTCEFAQYAPSGSSGTKETILNDAASIIDSIESQVH